MAAVAMARSPRATVKFKYKETRESGLPKTLITLRLEDSLLAKIAAVGNREHVGMSTAMRIVLRRGLGMSDYPRPAPKPKKSAEVVAIK